MKTLKIYLSVNTDGYTNEAIEEMIKNDTQRLINMFKGYSIEVHTKRELNTTGLSNDERTLREISLLKRCDIYAMGTDWTNDRSGKIERNMASAQYGIPCVNTDAEYTANFLRDYIIAKCK